MKNIEEKSCLCALNRIFGFEPKIALELISHLGSARAIFELSPRELEGITGPFFKYKDRICTQAIESEMMELEKLAEQNITFCGWDEDGYPELLKECEDPPIGLYVKSTTPLSELWRPSQSLAIVGTRDISPYGTEWCCRIVKALAQTGACPTIISGLALGTDIIAHRTAIENSLPTIGVMATGPETIYPHRHRDFAQKLAQTPGCALVTDYPPGTAPVAINFLRRNRIIAGLSSSTIIIESKIKGGGMMTCRLAFSYNRDVYALPGRVDDLRSQGCNELIRRKIAEPITSEKELIDSLGFISKSKNVSPGLEKRIFCTYSGLMEPCRIKIMESIIKTIKSYRGITLEELPLHISADTKTIAELTGMLEIDGFINIDLMQRCSINYKNV